MHGNHLVAESNIIDFSFEWLFRYDKDGSSLHVNLFVSLWLSKLYERKAENEGEVERRIEAYKFDAA